MWRRQQVRVGLAALVSAVVALAGVVAGSAPRAAAAGGCADVFVIGARGSGEDDAVTDPADGGLGRPVAWAKDELTTQLEGLRVDGKQVDYPAASVAVLGYAADRYFIGLNEGLGAAKTILKDQAAACPFQQFVLAGYSQGAMVMHRLLHELVGLHSPLLVRIAAAILIGDGDRVPNDTNMLYGAASPAGHGIGQLWRSQSGASPDPFGAVGARVRTVCRAHDIVCDAPSWLALLGTLLLGSAVTFAVIQHLLYPGSGDLRAAVDAAATDVRRRIQETSTLEYVTFTTDGRLQLGMTLQQARAAYLGLATENLSGGCTQWQVHDAGNSAVTAYTLETADSGGRVVAIYAPQQGAKTDRGVGVGSTLQAVRQAYRGVPVSTTTSQAGTVLLVDGDGSWLGFNDLDGDGLVDGITVSEDKDIAGGMEVCSG